MSPKPGDVLRYAYLWGHEADQGLTEGLKDRPCVVVISVSEDANGLKVIVCPVSSQMPDAKTSNVEIPLTVKRHLGLTDRQMSFVITAEINVFKWPGPDLRPIDRNGTRDVYFGKVPANLHEAIKQSVLTNARTGRLKSTNRDE